MQISYLIIDDEPLARKVVEKYASDIPFLEKKGICKDAFEAMEFLHENDIDLIFLDVNMPRLQGLDFLRMLKNPPMVIITTAYREYALEGFELDVIDYLNKPFSFQRFYKAIQKVQEKFRTQKTDITQQTIVRDTKETDNFIFVKSDTKIFNITTIVLLQIFQRKINFYGAYSILDK